MATLSIKEKETAKGFLLDLFYAGGLIQQGDTSVGSNLVYRKMPIKYYSQADAAVICEELKYRAFDFFKVDKALINLSGRGFFADPTNTSGRGSRPIKRSKEMLAAYIANFCQENQIFWDDLHTNKTTYEMEQYKNTVIGGALWAFNCFLSQVVTNQASDSVDATPVSKTRASSVRVPGQTPVNNYKQSGPQSGNIRDLHGKPGQKVLASASGSNVIFYIEGVNAKATTSPARALIKPLTKGADVNGTNKVFISSGHGYTDCVCYFDNLVLATDFLKKCQAICPAHITNLKVVKRAADRNGYFLVGTEFGEVAISAKQMNEQREGLDYDINNIEAYEEAMLKYE